LPPTPSFPGQPSGQGDLVSATRGCTEIKPIVKRGDTTAALAEGQGPENFWRAVNGTPNPDGHTAPPSIVQIKISRILEEQATAPVKDRAEPQQEAPIETAPAPASPADKQISDPAQPSPDRDPTATAAREPLQQQPTSD